jgi:hypothetical protein
VRTALALALLAVAAAGCGSKEEKGFDDYMKKSKAIEPKINLNQIVRAAKMYYFDEHVGASGEMVAQQFPPSAPLTPATECCRQPEGKCAPDPSLWTGPTWEALGFAVDAPHYYAYEIVSSGTGPTATFTARAIGNLDCDGTQATFEVSITGADVDGAGAGTPTMTEVNPLD